MFLKLQLMKNNSVSITKTVEINCENKNGFNKRMFVDAMKTNQKR